MQLASTFLVMAFVAIVTLWPIALVVAVAYHSLAKRWRRVGQVALLLPVWTVAASVGLLQMPRLMAALEAPSRTPTLVTAGTAIGFALCCAALAWGLLIRSFGGQASSGADQPLLARQQPLAPDHIER